MKTSEAVKVPFINYAEMSLTGLKELNKITQAALLVKLISIQALPQASYEAA